MGLLLHFYESALFWNCPFLDNNIDQIHLKFWVDNNIKINFYKFKWVKTN
jgi:hypothetical protein